MLSMATLNRSSAFAPLRPYWTALLHQGEIAVFLRTFDHRPLRLYLLAYWTPVGPVKLVVDYVDCRLRFPVVSVLGVFRSVAVPQSRLKAPAKPEDGFIPSDETVKFYIDKFKLSYKDYKTCEKFNKEELYAELESVEKEMLANKKL